MAGMEKELQGKSTAELVSLDAQIGDVIHYNEPGVDAEYIEALEGVRKMVRAEVVRRRQEPEPLPPIAATATAQQIKEPVTEDTPGFRGGFTHVSDGFRRGADGSPVCVRSQTKKKKIEKIISTVKGQPGISQADLLKALDVSWPTLNNYLKLSEVKAAVEKKNLGPHGVHYYPVASS